MNILNSTDSIKFLKKIAFVLSAISVLLFFLSPSFTLAAQEGDPEVIEQVKIAEALKELIKSMNIEAFAYEVENRSDPFMPFISEKTEQPTEIDSRAEKLTGMRQFEPGQLELVAIMFTESNPMAMVEDSAGKGYIIRRGTKIGRSGIVSDIVPNQVVIKQLTYSMTRERKYKTVEMILRKEGEHK